MARARWLKPELFTDSRVCAVSDQAVLVFEACWVEADDGGVAPGDPRDLYGRRFIKRPTWTVETVAAGLAELERAGLLRSFEHKRELFVLVPRFAEKQGIKPKEWRHLGPDHIATTNAVLSQSNAVPMETNPVSRAFTPKQLAVAVAVAIPRAVAKAEAKLSRKPRAMSPGNGRETPLTPFGDVWKAKYGGDPAYGRLGKALKPLLAAHAPDVVLRHWTHYLDQTEAEFASPERFAQTFGRWSPDHVPELTAAERALERDLWPEEPVP